MGIELIVLDRELFVRGLRPLLIAYRQLFTQMFGPPITKEKDIWVWETRSWTGKTNLVVPAWTWPKSIQPGNGVIRVQGRGLPSNIHQLRPR